jgi:hypothetical protein
MLVFPALDAGTEGHRCDQPASPKRQGHQLLGRPNLISALCDEPEDVWRLGCLADYVSIDQYEVKIPPMFQKSWLQATAAGTPGMIGYDAQISLESRESRA